MTTPRTDTTNMIIHDRAGEPVAFDSRYILSRARDAVSDATAGDAMVADPRTLEALVTAHTVLVMLRYYANTEGNGVVTESELGRLMTPMFRSIREILNPDGQEPCADDD